MEIFEKTTVLGANCRLCANYYKIETIIDLNKDKEKYEEITSILSFLNASYVDFSINGQLSLAICQQCYQFMIKIYEFLCQVQNAQHKLSSLSVSNGAIPDEVCSTSKEVSDQLDYRMKMVEVKSEPGMFKSNCDHTSDIVIKLEIEPDCDNPENPFENLKNTHPGTLRPLNFIKAEYSNEESKYETDKTKPSTLIKNKAKEQTYQKPVSLIKEIHVKPNQKTKLVEKVGIPSIIKKIDKNVTKNCNKTKLEATKNKKELAKDKSSNLKITHETDEKLKQLQDMYNCKTRTCKLCNKIFNTRQMLYYHVTKQHRVQWPSKIRKRIPKGTPLTQDDLTCQYCKKVFATIRNLRRHISSVHAEVEQIYTNKPEDNIVIERTECTNKSVINNNLETNVHGKVKQTIKTDVESKSMEDIKHSSEINNSQQDTSSVFNDLENKTTKAKETVEKQELTDPKLICDTCNRTFSKIGNLIRHILTHKQFEENVNIESNDLQNSNGNSKDLKRNETDGESSDELEEPYDPKIQKCDSCCKTFVNRQSLYKHKIKWHGYKTSKRRKRGSPRTQEDLTCQYCNKVFTKMKNLYAHVSVIHRRVKKELICDKCGKTYHDPASLRVHVKTHAPKPLVCKICSARYTDTYKLRNHILTHSNERNHPCKCGAAFKNQISLNAHIRNQHANVRVYTNANTAIAPSRANRV